MHICFTDIRMPFGRQSAKIRVAAAQIPGMWLLRLWSGPARSTGKRGMLKMGLGLTCALLFCAVAAAQTGTGTIVGTVVDPSGAVIRGAHVVAENVNTGVKNQTTTNKAGAYSFRFLPIGHYEVTVTHPGFALKKVSAFRLNLDQTAHIDVHLAVGATSTTTLVKATTAQLLDTNNATLGIVMTSKEIKTIPLKGENFASVALYQPGAVDTGPGGLTGGNALERDTYNNDIVSTNGNRNQDNWYEVDGIPMNQIYNNLIGYNPAPPAISEMKVISANGSAEYGDANGGTVLAELKSGTNHFHGSVYAHLENQNLDANSWYNNHQNPIIPKNPYTQTIFGATLGGPILRNKLFFFADYLGVRRHQGGLGSASVLTSAMRQGNFSSLLSLGSHSIQLYNTQNNFAPYANNQVPVINPVAKYIFAHPKLYPLPNATPVNGIAEGNLQGPTSSYNVNNQYDLKFDYDANPHNTITAFYSDSQPYDGHTSLIPIQFPNNNKYPTHIGGATWIHIYSPAIVNQVHLGFTRVNWINGIPFDPTGQFGLKGDSLLGIPLPYKQQYDGFTAQGIGGFNTLGNSANLQVLTDNQFYYSDALTWQRGQQLMSMGGQALRYQENFYTAENYGFLGSYSYNGQFTSNPNASGNEGIGFAGADFVLDRVSSAHLAENGGLNGTRQWRLAAYFQDDWRVSHHLTLNLGLRYQFDQPWYEVHNKLANVLLHGPEGFTVEYAGHVPAGAPAGSVVCPTRSCYDATYTQFMPRFGFAYQVRPWMVVSGGYGATSDMEGNASSVGVPPYQLAFTKTALSPTKTSGGTPYTVESGFASQQGSSFYSTNGGFGSLNPHIMPQYVQQWNLTTQYALGSKMSFRVGYVGEVGDHLLNYRNANQLTSPGATAPLVNFVGQGGSLFRETAEAIMNYNALQATFRRQFSQGLNYTVNYTYAKALTTSSGFYGVANINGQNGAAQNGYDLSAEYGPSPEDIRNNLSVVLSYALPFGHGRQFGGNISRPLDEAVGGWNLSGTAIAYSGFPITIDAPDVSNTHSYGQERANDYRPLVIRNRSIQHWWGTAPSATPCATAGFNNGTCAYGAPAPGTFGSASVNSERAPGYRQIDMSIFKKFPTIKAQALTFRTSFFNVFNITSYASPSNNVASTTFGEINNVKSPPRTIQMSLSYTF